MINNKLFNNEFRRLRDGNLTRIDTLIGAIFPLFAEKINIDKIVQNIES